MLSETENELVCRTGPGTSMGNLFRRYWMPALLSEEVPEPDSPPVRVRLLGEDLVAYRDTTGQVGLIGEFCPHRLTSLYLGRNEEDGLRCVYHGWKFDRDGNCVDMPNEPLQSRFKEKIKTTAYPCQERGGIVWAYMGPEGGHAELPEMEWTLVPEGQRRVSKVLQECNYLQGLEGGIDSSHISFLHANAVPGPNGPQFFPSNIFESRDGAPIFTVRETDYGMLIGARRSTSEPGNYYWRFTPFGLPFYTQIPPTGRTELLSGHAWVPIDDENCWMYTFSWHIDRPISDFPENAVHPAILTDKYPGTYNPRINRTNNWGLDREMQRTQNFTGIANTSDQDRAVQEAMHRIVPRMHEHLGTSDTAVISTRRILIRLARELEQGNVPASALNGALYRVRSASLNLPNEDLLEPEEAARHLASRV